MAAEYAPILQEGSNFRKKTAKKFILPPKFRKVRFEMHKKFTVVAKFTDEQYTIINQSTAGRFDPRVFVNCLQVLTKTLGSKCPAVD